jgi:hypothetical protein
MVGPQHVANGAVGALHLGVCVLAARRADGEDRTHVLDKHPHADLRRKARRRRHRQLHLLPLRPPPRRRPPQRPPRRLEALPFSNIGGQTRADFFKSLHSLQFQNFCRLFADFFYEMQTFCRLFADFFSMDQLHSCTLFAYFFAHFLH